jgi:hypothetical protein
MCNVDTNRQREAHVVKISMQLDAKRNSWCVERRDQAVMAEAPRPANVSCTGAALEKPSGMHESSDAGIDCKKV